MISTTINNQLEISNSKNARSLTCFCNLQFSRQIRVINTEDSLMNHEYKPKARLIIANTMKFLEWKLHLVLNAAAPESLSRAKL